MFRVSIPLLVVFALPASALAQAQAANAVIEGTVKDPTGAVLPGVLVRVTNTDTGAEREVVTNESGLYRAPLLPLGTYRVSAELQGFKKVERAGIVLVAGETAVVDVTLDVGAITEVVTITADSPIVDPAKIDLGRTLNEREIKNLPLPSRNPYNFALLQPGVTGFETQEFGVPRFSANGSLLRVNYQIDGNNNTEKDRAGLRLIPMSEVMIREVKVVTSGYAPEFGQTTGLVYNAITPSGTNTVRGAGSYRFQRKALAAYPFFFQGPKTDDRKPPTKVDVVTAEIGGPFVRDQVHYFFGFENTYRDLGGGRVITIVPANAARLGLAPQPGAMPAEQTTQFFIAKTDYQAAAGHRVTARYIYFDNDIANNIGGGLNSTQVATDFFDTQHSAAVQLVSTLGSNRLNELRAQYATRHQNRLPGDLAGRGPNIVVTGVANFGGPIGGSSDAGFDFRENVLQILDNFTYIRSNHSYKFGFDFQHVTDERTSTLFQRYTFPTIDAYLAAASGANPRTYSNFAQFFGEPSFDLTTRLYSLFAQDDWRLSPDLKVLYGIRYDLYDYPEANANAPLESSRTYTIDRNNWGPRVGIAWTLGTSKRSVVRASTGLMYDQPLLRIYEDAINFPGSADRVTVSLGPTSPGAPAYPQTLENRPAGFVPPPQTPSTVDPGFVTARTFQNNVQFERALSDNYSASVGFVYTRGYDLPVITNVNLINPIGALADGRPIFSTAVNATTRRDPRFNGISMVQSIGESTYRALTLQLTRRFTKGVQFDLAYTLGKGEDNAPLTSVLSVQGDAGRVDPTSLERDRGPNILDQRHTFSGSIVAETSTSAESPAVRALLNGNQFAVIMLFGSGLPFNIRARTELNNDAVASDRPAFVGRNSLYLPARYNVDLKYSRFVSLRGSTRLEVMGEFKNVFNTVQTSGLTSTVDTDALGAPRAPIPTGPSGFPASGGYEQRQFQLGFKLHF